jgi:hypothetical protein
VRLDVRHERADVCEHLAPDRLAGDAKPELLLNGAQQQQDVQGIDVRVAAKERHLRRHRHVSPELEVSADDRLDASESLGSGWEADGMLTWQFGRRATAPTRAACLSPLSELAWPRQDGQARKLKTQPASRERDAGRKTRITLVVRRYGDGGRASAGHRAQNRGGRRLRTTVMEPEPGEKAISSSALLAKVVFAALIVSM